MDGNCAQLHGTHEMHEIPANGRKEHCNSRLHEEEGMGGSSVKFHKEQRQSGEVVQVYATTFQNEAWEWCSEHGTSSLQNGRKELQLKITPRRRHGWFICEVSQGTEKLR